MTEINYVNSVIMSENRLVNTVTASFDTIMGQITKISQRKKTGFDQILMMCQHINVVHRMFF